jgi:hypothetical protein
MKIVRNVILILLVTILTLTAVTETVIVAPIDNNEYRYPGTNWLYEDMGYRFNTTLDTQVNGTVSIPIATLYTNALTSSETILLKGTCDQPQNQKLNHTLNKIDAYNFNLTIYDTTNNSPSSYCLYGGSKPRVATMEFVSFHNPINQKSVATMPLFISIIIFLFFIIIIHRIFSKNEKIYTISSEAICITMGVLGILTFYVLHPTTNQFLNVFDNKEMATQIIAIYLIIATIIFEYIFNKFRTNSVKTTIYIGLAYIIMTLNLGIIIFNFAGLNINLTKVSLSIVLALIFIFPVYATAHIKEIILEKFKLKKESLEHT